MRCLPLKGTAGLQRLAVSGWRREPSPPAMTKASTFLFAGILNSLRFGRLNGAVGQEDRAQGRHGDEGAGWPAAHRMGRGLHAPEIAHAAAAVDGSVAVEEFMPVADLRHRH